MKTHPPLPDRRVSSPLLTAALSAAFVLAATNVFAAAATTAEPKDHVLFVGTDVSVKEGDQFYQVVGATKDALQIDKGQKPADVKTGSGADIRVKKGVKLSNVSANISNVQTESVDRASARAQLQAMQASMLLADEADMAADRLHGRMVLANAVTGPRIDSKIVGADVSRTAVKQQQLEAQQNYTDALPGLSLLSSSANTYLVQNVAKIPTAEVRMSFDVSSPVPMEHPYIIVIATYAEDDKPDKVAREISTRQFDRLDGNAQHVSMEHAATLHGLPFKKFDVALFANGQEVATNLSEKRMSLTDDQAYQFSLIEYLSSHKGATLPPSPTLMGSRENFLRQAEGADMHQPIYVSVDRSGKVLARSADQAGREKLPAAIEAALEGVRFLPALSRGTPVQGTVKLTLAQLAQ